MATIAASETFPEAAVLSCCGRNRNFAIAPKGVSPTMYQFEKLGVFPAVVKREAGHQLDRVQRSLNPADWKPVSSVGKGVPEMRFLLTFLTGFFGLDVQISQ